MRLCRNVIPRRQPRNLESTSTDYLKISRFARNDILAKTTVVTQPRKRESRGCPWFLASAGTESGFPPARLCRNPFRSLRATGGSAAISLFSVPYEIASVVSLPRNDIVTQPRKRESRKCLAPRIRGDGVWIPPYQVRSRLNQVRNDKI